MRWILTLVCLASCEMPVEPLGVARPEQEVECQVPCAPDPTSQPAPPIASEKPQIHYKLRGAWGQWDELLISPTGAVSRPFSIGDIPSLKRQLSPIEHDSVLAVLAPLRFLRRSIWEPSCADAAGVEITFRDPGNDFKTTRRVYVYCWQAFASDTTGQVDAIMAGANKLANLSKAILDAQSPWAGLEGQVRVNATEFARTDTVVFDLSVRNPSGRTRVLYFPRSVETVLRVRTGGQKGRYTSWVAHDSGIGSQCWGASPRCPMSREVIQAGDSSLFQVKMPAADLYDSDSHGLYVAEVHLQSAYWGPYGRFELAIR